MTYLHPTTQLLAPRDEPIAPDEAELAAVAFLARYGGRTLDAYRHDLRNLFQWAVDHGLHVLEATRAHLEMYRSSMEESGLAASTIDRRLSTACGFYRFALIPLAPRTARTIDLAIGERRDGPILQRRGCRAGAPARRRTALTSRSVTAEAGVAKGVLHRHFTDFDHYGAHTPRGRTGRTVLRVDAGPRSVLEVLMAVEIHVDGRVAQGRLSAFSQGLERYLAYASDHGYALPRVLQGLSGPMNSIRLVYTYDDLAAYEDHEARTLHDASYAEAASAMEFFEGTITYSLFRTVE